MMLKRIFFDIIFTYPKVIMSIIISISVLSFFLYTRLPIETSVESLIDSKDLDLEFYERYKKQFGEDKFVVAAFSNSKMFEADSLTSIHNLTLQLEKVPEIKEVISLTNVETTLGSESDFIVQPLIPKIQSDQSFLDTIRSRALSNPLIAGNIISEDGMYGIFLIRIHEPNGDPNYESRLLSKIKEILKKASDTGDFSQFHIAGWPVTDESMATYMNQDLALFMPFTYLVIIVMLFSLLRNFWAVLISTINVSLCLVWTMAFLYLIGGSISPMTAILPPLIMALVISDSIHIFTEFFKIDRTDGNIISHIQCTIEKLWTPCFLTSFTTSIGFASLTLSNIPPIRHFGLTAAVGLMIEYILTMCLIPLGLYFLKNKKSLRASSSYSIKWTQYISNIISNIIPKIKIYIVFISFFLVAISLYGIFTLKVETNLIEYFRESSPVYQDMHFVDENLGGVNTIEISLRGKSQDAFLNPENLLIIEKISNYLKEKEIITKVTSINDFLKQMNKSFNNENNKYYSIPNTRELAAQYLLIYTGDELGNFVDDQFQWTRISSRTTEHRSSFLKKNIDEIQFYIDNITQNTGLTAEITGKTFMVNKLVKQIVDSQVESLTMAFLIIFCVLFFVLRSIRIGLISIIPNILPVIFNLGLMGLIGIPLNTATAIISAVALGIAVDDTIHYLHSYQDEMSQGKSNNRAAINAIINKGVSMITTSIVLITVFGILIFSKFVPTAQFGFLSAMIMLFALVCDMIILPGILYRSRNCDWAP